MGSAVDDTRLWVYATPAPGVALEELDEAIDRVLRRFGEEPIDAAHLQRAKTRLIADAIYAQDSQSSLARWYGESLATGLAIEDIVAWPDRMERVTAADVQNAARKWLDRRRAVTGFLLPA
jgi:zinc protease